MLSRSVVKTIVIALGLFFYAGQVSTSYAGDCSIETDNLQQRMTGFGGSTAWAGGLADSLINRLFSPTDGCGLTLMRMRIAPNATTGAGEINIAKKAQALGASIWASPWSPPAQFKDNNNVNNGGSLLPEHYQDWADQLVNYVKNLKNQGVNLKWISVQNEPNWTATYESCRYTPQQIVTFIADYLGPSLEKAGLETRIIAPEVINWGSLKPYGDAILNNATALKYCDVIATHSYGDEPRSPNFPYNLIKEKGKELWQTEYGFDQFAGDESMVPGIAIAKQMHGQIVNGPVSAYHTWWIIPADGVNGTASNGLVMRGKVIQRGYVMGNYSRFVRPGSFRVSATSNPSTGVLVTAYRNDSLGQMTIVAINENANPVEQRFVLDGLSVSSFIPWETSDNVKLTARAAVNAGTSFSYTLPARSVISFVGNYRTMYRLTVQTLGDGTVSRSPDALSFEENAMVSLTAQPQAGWSFYRWTGLDGSGNTNPITVVMDMEKSLTAYFFRNPDAEGNLVLNGGFSSGTSDWTLNIWDGDATGSVNNGVYGLLIGSIGTNNYDIQLVQPGIFLENGKTYQVTFDAYAAANRMLEVNVEMANSPWTSYLAEVEQFELTTEKKTYAFTFTMNHPTDVNGRLGFNAGMSTDALFIDNVSVKAATTNSASPSVVLPRTSGVSIGIHKSMLRVDFNVPVGGAAALKMYDLKGNSIKNVRFGIRAGETYSRSINLRDVPKGFYLVKLEIDGRTYHSSEVLISK